MAAAIAVALGDGAGEETEPEPLSRVDVHEMVKRRARRQYRVPIEFTPTSDRDGFEQTVVGYTASQAMAEADRCLDCHTMCSLCVGVCPNMALLTYGSEPLRAALPRLHVVDGELVAGEREAYRADQALQIAVLTDFCNECGNCVTACPTSGEPYRDKPRVYLDQADFEAESDNAFMLLEDGTVQARYDGATHRLSLNGSVEYSGPAFSARLEAGSLAFIEGEVATGAAGSEALSLRPAADMYVLARGLHGSMGHLPAASGDRVQGTRITQPAYAD